eukprot:GDKI01002940.1.p2 GENE.GDKI01002940.1~~GDKI01002940.1.p2  ORF type:complete len:115 (+),score=17.37 GDKI01002940.1:135-479(+)
MKFSAHKPHTLKVLKNPQKRSQKNHPHTHCVRPPLCACLLLLGRSLGFLLLAIIVGVVLVKCYGGGVFHASAPVMCASTISLIGLSSDTVALGVLAVSVVLGGLGVLGHFALRG